MNQQQLEELKKMSAGQIARKYTPMLIKRQITREQFDWLLSQASSTSPEATESTETNAQDTISQLTTHEDEIAGRTQKQRLYNLLSDGEWHDTPEILQKVFGAEHSGRANIPARKKDLVEDGHVIENRHKHGSVWEMRLVRSEQSVLVPDARAENIQSNVSEWT